MVVFFISIEYSPPKNAPLLRHPNESSAKGVVVDQDEARRLLALSDPELAWASNHWRIHTPTATVVDHGLARQKKVPKGIVGIFEAWSSPRHAKELLKELGAVKRAPGPNENRSDGECDVYFSVTTGNDATEEFRLESNYYRQDCFVPVIRWALKKFLEKGA